MKTTKIEHDDILEGIIETLEKQTGKKIEYMEVLNDREENPDIPLEVFILFTDRAAMRASIIFFSTDDKIALRIQGNYL